MGHSKGGGRGPRPTIRDVARAAGVSRATVSRVLNGGHWVGADSQAKVEAAMAEVGYAANQHARFLAAGRAGSVGFLLSQPHELLFEDPNLSVLLRHTAQALAEHDLPLTLMVAASADERRRISGYLQAGHVDGVLLVSSRQGDPMASFLVENRIPAVSCGKPLGMEGRISYAGADDRAGARAITRHLLDKGRRRIAMVAGPQGTSGGAERLAGWREAMGDAAEESLIATGDFSLESGARATRELLERDLGFDAVFAASDLMAAGVLAVLRQRGLAVPADVAVVGFDDSGPAASLDPPLTTMRQPLAQIASQMVRLLLAAMDGAPPEGVLLPVELVERASA
ncbi:MAG: LacI family transcriptional regulator [Bifidobacteriaceae bacterium]|nr:LacI family transcriptional regulator [Bifidobacteriaceae bacterium]